MASREYGPNVDGNMDLGQEQGITSLRLLTLPPSGDGAIAAPSPRSGRVLPACIPSENRP